MDATNVSSSLRLQQCLLNTCLSEYKYII